MTISMYQASVPVFTQTLTALSGILDKVDAWAAEKKYDPAVVLSDRLFPNMWPLIRQVQAACDTAKGVCARLAGVPIPSHEDTEKTIPELKARIKKTIDFLATLKPAQIDGCEAKDLVMKMGPREVAFKGQSHLFQFGLPNFFFHATTAYNILRTNGLEIGKRDFLGPFGN